MLNLIFGAFSAAERTAATAVVASAEEDPTHHTHHFLSAAKWRVLCINWMTSLICRRRVLTKASSPMEPENERERLRERIRERE